jgi:hypothetical protein
VVRTIKAAPVDLIDADRAAMLALPPVPLHLGWRNTIRLGRDYYVRLDTNDYCVDPMVIGRMVEVAADLERVRVRAEGRVVAEHPRVWARGTTITDPAHVEVAGLLRKQFQQPRTPATAGDDLGQELARYLSGYDRAFGLSSEMGITNGHRQERHHEPQEGRRKHGGGQVDHLPRRRVEGTADHRIRRPAGRPGPGRGLDP